MKKLLLFFILSALALFAAEPPFACVPKLDTPPPLDEPRFLHAWRQAVAFSGMLDTEGPRYLGGRMDVSWWVGYDDRALYLSAIVYAPSADVFFRAEARGLDDPRIETDDHLVIAISLRQPGEANGKPHLRLRINSSGSIFAEERDFLPGQDRTGWASKITGISVIRNKMNTHIWTTRIAIPLAELGVKSLDNRDALIHLGLATAPFYLSWGGAAEGDWQQAGRLHFIPDMPVAAHLNQTNPGYLSGLLPEARAEVALTSYLLAGIPDAKASVTYTLSNPATGWSRTFTHEGVGGERFRDALKEDIPLAETGGNALRLEAIVKQRDKEMLAYRDELPLAPADDATRAQVAAWRAARTVTPAATSIPDFVYSPYKNALFVSLDVRQDLDRLDGNERAKAERWLTADHCDISLDDRGLVTISLKDGYGEGTTTFPEALPAGTHTMHYRLFHQDTELAAFERTLVREQFPWEHNAIGKDRVVIPPFEPITQDGRSLHIWGRKLTIGPNGLPASAISQGRELLAGPIHLQQSGQPVTDQEATITLMPGQRIPASYASYELNAGSCPTPELVPTDGFQAVIAADSVYATLDYEGWYQVTLTAHGQPSELIIPLAEDATIMRWSRNVSPGEALAGCGAIPGGDGILYHNKMLPGDDGQSDGFVPLIYIGTPSEGLWWLAESNEGWIADGDEPTQILERINGHLQLRLRLICNASNQPRDITFALLPSPVRPRPPNFRRLFYQARYSHDTAGFRMYGRGVDGFGLYTEDDYAKLHRFLYESPEFLRKTRHARDWGAPIILYGSTYMASAGMLEFPTFGSEWLQTSHLERHGRIQEEFRDKQNRGGSYTWTSDLQCTPIATSIPDSFIDCHLWHMTRIGQYAGINGNFYDNYKLYPNFRPRLATDLTGVAWCSPDGHLEPKSTLFRRHQWTKRFATAYWLMGRPPFQLGGNEPESSFQPVWFVEGVNDVEGDSDYLRDGKTLDTYAAWTLTSSRMSWSNASFASMGTSDNPILNLRGIRVALAYCLLLDVPLRPKGWQYKDPIKAIVDSLDAHVGFFTDAVQLPYWRQQDWNRDLPVGLIAGGYRSSDSARTAILYLNTAEVPIDLDLKLPATDLESAKAVQILSIPPRDFRLVGR